MFLRFNDFLCGLGLVFLMMILNGVMADGGADKVDIRDEDCSVWERRE